MSAELPRNSMTILELEGRALERLLDSLAGGNVHTLRVAVEVEVDGATYLKYKVNEGTWSIPLEDTDGATARAERLYA